MKTTTTLYYIIKSELIKAGHSEFVNDHQLTFFNNDHSFIKKIIKYDTDVERIVNDLVFHGVVLEHTSTDRTFKKEFINKFLYREIAFQTLELFSSQVVHNLMINLDYINQIYNGLDDYITGKSTTVSTDQGDSTTDNRYLSSTLPQSEINLNVDNTQLNYGDVNTISKTKDQREGSSNSESNRYSLDDFLKTKNLKEEIFLKFDQKCFLQIW